ncbi:response regulator transcription factor [Halioxenophilus sp. WMMB6]|uniref:response regulator transcription factor n=1 Tax=Halioxenophilus sp. WMMB6 TaxID=3073815 RepID=UPI00295F3C6D|nr:response regulator transcription factor [Halioxenophilus sp. WMMB6]
MLTVLLVEDDLDLAATVVQYLSLEGVECDHASNGVAGLELMRRQQYDVLLLDLNLPKLDGLSVCQQLRRDGNDTSILMLTARDQLQDKLAGFDSGTDDYLVKPFELQELVVRIKALAKRRSGQTRVLRWADLEMNLDSKQVTRAGRPIKLSPLAWQLLEELMRAAPAVVAKAQLEQSLWGDDLPDSNALKVHLHHLRKALAGADAVVETVAGQGFALRGGGH